MSLGECVCMFGVLFKHHMSACARSLLIFVTSIFAFCLLSIVIGYASFALTEFMLADSAFFDVLYSLVTILFMFNFCVLCMAPWVAFVYVLYRFYKDLFCDDEFLSHMQGLNAAALVASSMLSGLLIMVIISALSGLGLYGACFAADGFGASNLFSSIPLCILSFVGSGTILYGSNLGGLVIGALNLAAQVIALLFLSYASFALGSTASEKHKVGTSVGILVAVHSVFGLVSSSVIIILLIWSGYYAQTFPVADVILFLSILSWLICLILAVTSYFFCVRRVRIKFRLIQTPDDKLNDKTTCG